MGMHILHKGLWEDKHIFSGFHSSVMWPPTVYELVWPQGLFDWLPDHMTWVDLPCCYWLNLKLQVDFTSLAIHTKLHILGAENTVLKYGEWVTRSKSKVSRPLFSLVLVAGDMICFVVKSESLMKRSLWSRLYYCWRLLFSHPIRLLRMWNEPWIAGWLTIAALTFWQHWFYSRRIVCINHRKIDIHLNLKSSLSLVIRLI